MASQDQAAWYDVIGRFKEAAINFDQAFYDLSQTPTPDDAGLAAEQAALLQRGTTIQNTVSGIRSALADVQAALSGAWDQVTGAWDWIAGQVGLNGYEGGGLGMPPLIPIAIVAGSIVTIGLFLSDKAKFDRRMQAYEASIAAGNSPEQAATAIETVSEAGTGGIISTVTKSTTTLGIVAAVVAVVWLLSGSRRK